VNTGKQEEELIGKAPVIDRDEEGEAEILESWISGCTWRFISPRSLSIAL
jgi:hypothetical protein